MNFSDFQEQIGITFINKELLKKAFTHRSYINENRELHLEHNERLEFLGDAVLELVVTDFLFSRFPEKTEGDLTAYRAALVNTQTLASVAGELNFNDLLLLSRGETKDTGRARQFILANTVEALIGAVYLDQGYDMAVHLITQSITPRIDAVIDEKTWIDSKSLFQERAQEEENTTPSYKTIRETGPDHDKSFTVGVFLKEKQVGQGEGNSKQEAEQGAAHAALLKYGWE